MINRELPTPPDLIVFDFDGVFTDNTVYVDENGVESVRCSRADGLGLSMLRKRNVNMCILSTEKNPVVTARAHKLGITAFQGCEDKKKFLATYLLDKGLNPERVIYMGDDINDYEAMLIAGFRVCPNNAHMEIKKIVDIVLSKVGGHGAVRELCDLLMLRDW